MPRANHYFLQNHVWHMTHSYHLFAATCPSDFASSGLFSTFVSTKKSLENDSMGFKLKLINLKCKNASLVGPKTHQDTKSTVSQAFLCFC